MSVHRLVHATCAFGFAICSSAGHAQTQSYPAKPIRIVTASPGSSTDLVSRMIAQGLAERLGQPVIVENRGGGFLQGDIVAKAEPDGYTLANSAGGLWISFFAGSFGGPFPAVIS